MTDIAALGLKVDSSDLPKATQELNRFSNASKIASAANDNLTKSTDRMNMVMGRAKLAAAAFAAIIGVAAVGALRKFIDATGEAQKVQAQLGARITSTGMAAGRSIDQLNAHAKALQGITTYGDEAIGSAQALLLTFTNIKGGTFDAATKAVLNMSTAMGQDLKSSAMQLGKALNDPIGGIAALSRVGVQFTDDQKAMIESMAEAGNTAGAQAVILKELETQMGGAAEAARNTLPGALAALKEAWGDAFELADDKSSALTGSINDLTKAISSPEFTGFVQTIGVSVVTGLTNAVAWTIALGRELGKIPSLLNGIGDWFSRQKGIQQLMGLGGGGPSAEVLKAQMLKQRDLVLALKNRGASDAELRSATSGLRYVTSEYKFASGAIPSSVNGVGAAPQIDITGLSGMGGVRTTRGGGASRMPRAGGGSRAAQMARESIVPFEREDLDLIQQVTLEMDKLPEIIDEAAFAAREFTSTSLKTFVSDLRAGKSATEALTGALGRLLEKLADAALDQFVSSMFGGNTGGGGPLTEIFRAFGIGARAQGGPVAGNTPYMVGERGPELFVPHGGGKIIPANQNGAGPVQIEVVLSISADNAGFVTQVESVSQRTADRTVQRAAPQIVSASVKQVDRNLPGMMNKAQRTKM